MTKSTPTMQNEQSPSREAAIEAIRSGFMTSVSDDGSYRIEIKYPTLPALQAAHSAILALLTPPTPQPDADREAKARDEYRVRRIAEVIEDNGGCWRPCSGCQEGDEGYVSTKHYPYDPAFRCQPGSGCSECGGIGVIWEDGEFLASYGDALADATRPQVSDEADRCGWCKYFPDSERCDCDTPGQPSPAIPEGMKPAPQPVEPALLDRSELAWQRFFYPAAECFQGDSTDLKIGVLLELADCLRLVLATVGRDVQLPSDCIPPPIEAEGEPLPCPFCTAELVVLPPNELNREAFVDHVGRSDNCPVGRTGPIRLTEWNSRHRQKGGEVNG